MPATAKQLSKYFEDWLGESARSDQAVVRVVEAGLPTGVVNRLRSHGLTSDEIYRTIINPRTLKHRRSRKQRLSQEESERAVRTVRVLSRAEAVFADRDKALAWLRLPKRRFEGRTPFDMLATEVGGRLVEEMLIQIDQGMFA